MQFDAVLSYVHEEITGVGEAVIPLLKRVNDEIDRRSDRFLKSPGQPSTVKDRIREPSS